MPLPSGTYTWEEWVARGFPRRNEMDTPCDHVWEELDDGTILCFECDKVRNKKNEPKR